MSLPYSSYYFRIGTFSERNFYLLGTLLENRKLAEELFGMKKSTEELLFRSRYFCTASTFSEELHLGKS